MTMCSRTSSPKIPIPESASPREATSVTSNMESYQTPVPQSDTDSTALIFFVGASNSENPAGKIYRRLPLCFGSQR
ncbi:hypothetical protein AXF42_Ash004033 [Apostasia shenzhenica]|uniref:Uncharacterized protein n=1 Tax=Apostasia shenzhenica TaxID=1088818 RepID=A0A2I0A1U4_9ASPA|nr:hypothetical protein AXF42_Ash004033 [Apostasia shenzhenica]